MSVAVISTVSLWTGLFEMAFTVFLMKQLYRCDSVVIPSFVGTECAARMWGWQLGRTGYSIKRSFTLYWKEQTNKQNKPGVNIKASSILVWPERVKKWPSALFPRWRWWWWSLWDTSSYACVFLYITLTAFGKICWGSLNWINLYAIWCYPNSLNFPHNAT